MPLDFTITAVIICAVVAFVSFRAGVQFGNEIRPKIATSSRDNNDDDSRNSAMAVDGPIYLSSTDLLLNTPEKFFRKTKMAGGFFYTAPHDGTALLQDNETAANAPPLMTRFVQRLNNATVTTSLLFSFSPDVERRMKTIFPDPLDENIFYSNSPAIFWDRDFNDSTGRLIVIMRIWLGRERYVQKMNWPKNTFVDNYFYTISYDRNFKPLNSGQIMGIPTRIGSALGDGPIEPRIFPAFNRSGLFVSFNTGMVGLKGIHQDHTLIWDYYNNKLAYPIIDGYSPMFNVAFTLPRDKHWSAFNLPPPTNCGGNSDVIHFVHNLDPLRILECSPDFDCRIIYAAGTREDNVFKNLKNPLRGGSPFVHYESTYYVSCAHATLFKKHPDAVGNTRRYYTTNFVLLRADRHASPPYRIVFVSDPLKIADQLLYSGPIVRNTVIEDPFIFPVGLIMENRDTAVIGVHINDYSAVLIRIRGLEPLLKQAIALDKATKEMPPQFLLNEFVGPNRFTRMVAEADSGIELY